MACSADVTGLEVAAHVGGLLANLAMIVTACVATVTLRRVLKKDRKEERQKETEEVALRVFAEQTEKQMRRPNGEAQ